jgi:AraC-like DNA-binding protein
MSDKSAGKPVLIAAYGTVIAVALEQRNIDAGAVFMRANVPMYTTSDPMRRMSNLEVAALFRESVKATNDPYFGLFVGKSFPIGNLHALGFALLSSSSLRDFFLRLKNYYHLLSENVEITLAENAGEVSFSVELVHPDICYETEDAFIALIVRLIRMVSEPSFAPRRVGLKRPQPDEGDAPYIEYCQCEVLFDQPVISIHLDSASFDAPLPGASKELALMHDKTAMEYLAKLGRQDICGRIRVVIVDILSSGAVSKQQVADRLHLSTSNLELKLSRENTNFQRVLDSTRQSLATGYIEQSSISITETAYLLGFSDAANFTRAFKRWMGKSPLEYRKSLGLDH